MAKRGGFPGGAMPGNMANLMKQAQRMQRQMEEGQKEILGIKLSEEVVDPEDIEMLQDLIVAAVNEALRKAEEASAEIMGKMTGGLGGMPF